MKLTAHTFITADGVMQAPGGAEEDTDGGFARGGWMIPFIDETFGEVVDGWFGATSAILLGRNTYDMMAGHWPLVTDPADTTAAVLNSVPKYVASRSMTLDQAIWAGTRAVVGADLAAEVSALKAGGEGELQVHGSWQLVQALSEHGLVDEYRIIQFPTVVGHGKRLFGQGTPPMSFETTDIRVAPSGAVAMTLLPREFQTAGIAIVDGVEQLVG